MNHHAPLPVATDGEAANPGPRWRARGPRSIDARERRLLRNNARLSSASVAAPAAVLAETHWDRVSIMQVNIRGLISHAAELVGRLRLLPTLPLMLCLNETFLNKSVGEVPVEGYTCVSRHDRADGRWGGGVATYVQSEFAQQVTSLGTSDSAERERESG